MNKTKELSWLIICLLVIGNFFIFLSVEPVKSSGNTIWVDDDFLYASESDGSLAKPFKYIQSAINVAENGDTIKVFPGIYSQDLIICKSVTITNDDKENTILNSDSKSAYFIDITADSVSLEGFTINDYASTSHRKAVIHISKGTNDVNIINNLVNHSTNGYGLFIEGVENEGENHKAVIKNNIFNGTLGLNIKYSHSNTIFGNQISNSTTYGIGIWQSDGNYLSNNTIENSSNSGLYGNSLNDCTFINNTVFFNGYAGISLNSGGGNLIENNIIRNNSVMGIDMGSSQGIINYNHLAHNDMGIALSSNNNIIKNNTIALCGSYGILAHFTSNKNIIFNNTFTGEPIQSHARDDGNNYWNDSNLNGNYWDDYYGPDNNNDSIGDIPYTRGSINDLYPKGIFQKPPIISNPVPAHLASNVSLNPILHVDVVDPEGERVNVYFYYLGDSGYEKINSYPINIASGETASININPTYSYLGLGYEHIYLWYVVVEDTYSNTSSLVEEETEWIFTTARTPIDNDPPIADAGGPYEIQFGDEIQFDGSGCNDTDGTIEFYRWSFGDGTNAINIQSPAHTYKNTASEPYKVSLVVIDNYGSSSNDTTTVTIIGQENDPPVAIIEGPTSGTKGKSILFDGSGSYDPDSRDTINYTWSFGDGGSSTEASPSYKYNIAGNFDVVLTVQDQFGETNTSTINIVIKSPDEDNGLSGFEMALVIIAIVCLFVIKKKNKN